MYYKSNHSGLQAYFGKCAYHELKAKAKVFRKVKKCDIFIL